MLNRARLILALVATAGTMVVLLVAIAGDAAALSARVIRCPTRSGLSGPLPATPPSIGVHRSAGRLVAYTNSESYLLAPGGMSCSGLAATDGGSQLIVWPKGDPRPGLHTHAAGLTLTVIPACVGCKAQEVCPFFGAYARRLGFPCSTQPAQDERVVKLRPNAIAFEDPPGVAGAGWPSGGPYAANGVVGYTEAPDEGHVYRATCTLPASEHRVCTASLNDVISRYG